MSDDSIQRADDDQEIVSEETASDLHAEAIRSLPRLRSVEELTGNETKDFVPPPPMVNRVGGFAQGCGGVLLSIMGLLMLVVAMWFGFYVWGPALLMSGGMLLVGATMGVWRGRRTPVIVSVIVLIVMAGVGYFWNSFLAAAGALSPLGSVGVIFGPASLLAVLVLLVSLITNGISLGAYWKRLLPVQQRGAIIWTAVAAVLVVATLVLHVTQQQQRKSWLEDRLDTWSAEAAADDLLLGSNTNITLGYSFVTLEEGDDTRLDLRQAELDAALEAGAGVVRVSASGDMLFEAETPRMFKDDEEDEDWEQKAADRIARQAADEAAYMARVTESGADLLLADSQYSPYMLVWANDEEEIPWETFTNMQEQRVRHYAEQYQPAVYEIINEPDAYKQYSAINEPDDADMVELWLAQTERLIAAVHEVSPDTLVGVTIALQNDRDLDYYELVLGLEDLDFIGFRIFQPGAFDEIETIFDERGSAVEQGKQVWIMETWYGYCLAPQRSTELDGLWLEATAAFAAKEQMTAVLESDFGCFLQEGGTLFQDADDLAGRTEVWEHWQTLVAQWQAR